MAHGEDKGSIVESWHKAFKRATDFDSWGQPVEAAEGYRRLAVQLQQFASKGDPTFSPTEKKVLDKVAICLDSRCKILQYSSTSGDGITLDDLRKLDSTFQNLLHTPREQFPVDISTARLHSQLSSGSAVSQKDVDERSNDSKVHGSLLPRPLPLSGMTHLTVHIEKIGLPEAAQYLDPFISVSVRDSQGKNLVTQQDTPIASYKEDTYIPFKCDVHIQKAIESFPPGFAVFFEFKHYKPKKKSISTKCWAFLERDEIKEGNTALELYKKPADYKRKSIRLLTVKPLFLHLHLQLYT